MKSERIFRFGINAAGLFGLCLLCACATPAKQEEPSVTFINDREIQRKLTLAAETMVLNGRLKPLKEVPRPELSDPSSIQARPSDENIAADEFYPAMSGKVLIHGFTFRCNKPECKKLHVSCSAAFAVAPDRVVFNAHAVNEKNENEFHFIADQECNIFPIRQILACDIENDIMVAETAGSHFTPFPLKENAEVGSQVFLISHPGGMFFSMAEGIVSRYAIHSCAVCHGAKVMAVTTPFARGSSGAPLLDPCGNVVGMVRDMQNIYFPGTDGEPSEPQMGIYECVPASAIADLLRKITEKQEPES